MRWIFALLIVLVSVTGVVYLAGRMQPEDHLATRSALIGAAPDAVWKRIGDVQNEPSWRPSVKSVGAAPAQDGKPCFTENVGIPLTLCVQRVDGERLRVVGVVDAKQRFSGTWTFVVQPGDATQPQGNTTRLTITEEATVEPAMWRGVMLMTGYDRTIKGYLNDLSVSFSGQKAQS